MSDKDFITEINRIYLDPRDILVIHVKNQPSKQELQEMRENVKEALEENGLTNTVLIAFGEVRFEAITPDQMPVENWVESPEDPPPEDKEWDEPMPMECDS